MAHNAVTVAADDGAGLEPFDPAELLARLLMHIPAPRLHLGCDYGWLLRRVYEADPLLCSCGAQMRILSFITDPPVVTKIVTHRCRVSRDPSRAPPPSRSALATLAS